MSASPSSLDQAVVQEVERSSVESRSAAPGVALDPGVGGAAPHVDAGAAHLLQEAPDVGVSRAARPGRGPLGDVLGQVAAALELGHDPQHRHQEAHVAGHRRLREQLVLGHLFEVGLELVDEAVLLG